MRVKANGGGGGVKPFTITLQPSTSASAYFWVGTLFDIGYRKFRIVSMDSYVSSVAYYDGAQNITIQAGDTTEKDLTRQIVYIRGTSTSGGYGKTEIEFS